MVGWSLKVASVCLCQFFLVIHIGSLYLPTYLSVCVLRGKRRKRKIAVREKYIKKPCWLTSVKPQLLIRISSLYHNRTWSLSRKRGFSWKLNRKLWKNIFSVGKKSTSILFFMKIKMVDVRMQIEGTKLIYVPNFSVLHSSDWLPECHKLHRF